MAFKIDPSQLVGLTQWEVVDEHWILLSIEYKGQRVDRVPFLVVDLEAMIETAKLKAKEGASEVTVVDDEIEEGRING